jgi:hypothetical protein
MLTIDERIKDDGTRECVTLDVHERRLVLQVGAGVPLYLPIDVLDRVMARYGKPLAPDVALSPDELLVVGEGRVLHRLRHRARYDVIAKDYLVWTAPEQEPCAALAITIAAALVHLGQAACDAQRN